MTRAITGKTHAAVERHVVHRIGWLRAAVLGANDGIVSTGSLIVGVAASGAGKPAVLVAGAAALVAGAMSMAAGEYVSVSSQADAEKADLDRERRELADFPDMEKEELAAIYRRRGLAADLAEQVAGQLMAKDALGAHARDELGISEVVAARPLQAALASAASFAAGAAAPLVAVLAAPRPAMEWLVSLVSLVCLVVLGWLGARTGGAPILRSVVRVTFWGVLAFAITALVGALFGAAG